MWNKWKSGEKGTEEKQRGKERGEWENTKILWSIRPTEGGEPTERSNGGTEGRMRTNGRTDEGTDGLSREGTERKRKKRELGWNSVKKAPSLPSSLGSRFPSGKQHVEEEQDRLKSMGE